MTQVVPEGIVWPDDTGEALEGALSSNLWDKE